MPFPSRSPILSVAAFTTENPIHRVLPMVGKTPLLEIRVRIGSLRGRIFAKYELLNLTGSIKDRMAAHILGRAYENGLIAPGDEIVEASSGNTAISFSALGRALGHTVRIFMPDWMSHERKAILRGFGAELVEVSREQGGFVGSVQMARDYAAGREHVFEPRQFSNVWNVEAHALTTGPEIIQELGELGLQPTAFVAGVGTGGTVMGVGHAFRQRGLKAGIHPMEPAESPVLTAGKKVGHHRIQGISDEFIPEIVHLGELDAIVAVPDGDAILMAQRMSRELGLGVGISSGANLLAALQLLEQQGEAAVVTTVLSDSNKKYLSTDLFRTEPVRPDHLTPRVSFEGWRAISACICPH